MKVRSKRRAEFVANVILSLAFILLNSVLAFIFWGATIQ